MKSGVFKKMSRRKTQDLFEDYCKLESKVFSAVAWIPENHTRRKVHSTLDKMFDIVEILHKRIRNKGGEC